MTNIKNPFRPGAGQIPPFLAGREKEQQEFKKLLLQEPVLKNLVLTGLRGVGKTVLLDTFKPIANEQGWLWAGTDLSESSSISEQALSIRILTDLSTLVSSFTIAEDIKYSIGFKPEMEKKEIKLNYEVLLQLHQSAPGLESDKLKYVLELVWNVVKHQVKGIVLAYDEAQILKDHRADKQFPMSMLLEVTQFLQRKGIPYLSVLTGLPTLFPSLVEARTYAERMFQVLTLEKLSPPESREAILKPIQAQRSEVTFSSEAVNTIAHLSGGYPYFIQFFCKEAFDMYIQQRAIGIEQPLVDIYQIIQKLDTDFYSGRWNRITDRQRDLLTLIAKLPQANNEFTVSEIKDASKGAGDHFTPSHINQMLSKMIDSGLIYKNRHGKYSFAVPMMADYINRQNIRPFSA